MGLVAANLVAMGTEQLLLCLVFLASYAVALGRLAAARTRLIAGGLAVCAAATFVVLSHPWEAGVMLLAVVPIGMGLFAGTTWVLWRVMADETQQTAVIPLSSQLPTAGQTETSSALARLRARLRFI